MQSSVFISDLHLAPDTEEANAALLAFLRGMPERVQNLFVLGDLFEYWIGDDGLDDEFRKRGLPSIAELEKELADSNEMKRALIRTKIAAAREQLASAEAAHKRTHWN